MIATNEGLPNNCSVCRQPIQGVWYAEHQDEARSGGGKCKLCAFPDPTNDDLTIIRNIGPARATELRINGITTMKQLASVDVRALAAVLKVTPSVVNDWKKEAAQHVL